MVEVNADVFDAPKVPSVRLELTTPFFDAVRVNTCPLTVWVVDQSEPKTWLPWAEISKSEASADEVLQVIAAEAGELRNAKPTTNVTVPTRPAHPTDLSRIMNPPFPTKSDVRRKELLQPAHGAQSNHSIVPQNIISTIVIKLS